MIAAQISRENGSTVVTSSSSSTHTRAKYQPVQRFSLDGPEDMSDWQTAVLTNFSFFYSFFFIGPTDTFRSSFCTVYVRRKSFAGKGKPKVSSCDYITTVDVVLIIIIFYFMRCVIISCIHFEHSKRVL